MSIERLNLEDVFVMELLVNKINEIIDELNGLDDRLTQRIDNNWKHHKQMSRGIENLKASVEEIRNEPSRELYEAEANEIKK